MGSHHLRPRARSNCGRRVPETLLAWSPGWNILARVVSPAVSGDCTSWKSMATPKEMDVVRPAYELWQQAGELSGKDDEFYHRAKEELQKALDKEYPPRMTCVFARPLSSGQQTNSWPWDDQAH